MLYFAEGFTPHCWRPVSFALALKKLNNKELDMKEIIYEVCWEGPFSPENVNDTLCEHKDKYALYSVYGSHPIYGNNILLYIGMTEIGVLKRLSEHDYWMDEERYGSSKIFVASIGVFESWEKSNRIEKFSVPERAVIEQVEQLLIYSNQPVHNTQSRKSAQKSKGIRIFNTNNYGSLLPEVSALYQWC